MAATPPRRARFTQTTTIVWDNGDSFDGYILIGVVPPAFDGDDSDYVTLRGTQPLVRLPQFAYVPIIGGVFQTESSIIFSSDIEPPNTKYVCWYYDNVGRAIAGPSSLFTITTDPFTPPILTLVTPVVGTTIPDPT